MQASDLVLVRGIAQTRATLDAWNDRPWPVLGRWFAGSCAITTLLLAAVWFIAMLSPPDATSFTLPGLHTWPSVPQVFDLLARNGLVLALHAMACVAGFIAGSALPQEAERYSGAWRVIHDKAGPLAIGFVVLATTFSLLTQSVALGQATSTLASQLDLTPAALLSVLMVHAVPELVALFLPLAAWIVASRRGDWHELLAATVATVALAIPMLVASAFVEVYLTPELLLALVG